MTDTSPQAPVARTTNGEPIQGTFRTITNGARKTVVTPGTAVQLATTSTACKVVFVQALPTNTKNVAIGDSTTLATAGTESGQILTPAASATIPIADVSLLWMDALVAGEGVLVVYFN